MTDPHDARKSDIEDGMISKAEGKLLIRRELPERNGQCKKFWMFVTVDKEGNESPCGMNTGQGWMMMGNSKWQNVEAMRPVAAKMASQSGLKIILREYHDCTDLEEFS